MVCICGSRQHSEACESYNQELAEQKLLDQNQRLRETITKFRQAITTLETEGPSGNIAPEVHTAMISGLKAQLLALHEQHRWDTQSKPCSGSGYAHKAHGACPGYTYDRT